MCDLSTPQDRDVSVGGGRCGWMVLYVVVTLPSSTPGMKEFNRSTRSSKARPVDSAVVSRGVLTMYDDFTRADSPTWPCSAI